MGRTARERLAKLLDDAEAPGAFSAQILAPADALQVEVDGVGAVQIPVRAPLAGRHGTPGRPTATRGTTTTITTTRMKTRRRRRRRITTTPPGTGAATTMTTSSMS
jgi:hypothetical protein